MDQVRLRKFLQTLASVALLFAGASGCSTLPAPPSITIEERIKLDDSLGLRLSESFEKEIQTRKIPESLNLYFHALAAKVAASQAELKASSVRVTVIRDRPHRWENFALPGNRIYLSEGLLKTVQFENEIIASLSLELAHLLRRHLIRKVESGASEGRVEFFGKAGVFDFSEKDQLEATDVAVELMYQAGYDPRGLLSYWEKFRKNRRISPYASESVVKFIEKTHQAIAAYSPLRNPVISSEEFLKNKKRIERL